MVDESIGGRIRALRAARGMSQADLAAATNVSRAAVAMWETGRACPSMRRILALAALLAVSADHLLGVAEPPREKPMAFAIRNLSVLAYAQGFTLWHYRAHTTALNAVLVHPATAAEVLASGFFDPARDMLAPGDMILVSAADRGMLVSVAAAEGGVSVVEMAGAPLPLAAAA